MTYTTRDLVVNKLETDEDPTTQAQRLRKSELHNL
jgi:hypothetical protein